MVGVYGYLPDILISHPDEAIGITSVNFGDVFYFG
jgi:hypothetical protein